MNTNTTVSEEDEMIAIKMALTIFAAGAVTVLILLWVGLTACFTWVDWMHFTTGTVPIAALANSIAWNAILAGFAILFGTFVGVMLGVLIGAIVLCWIFAGAAWELFVDWWTGLSFLRQARYATLSTFVTIIASGASIMNNHPIFAFVFLAMAFGSTVYAAATLFAMTDPSDLDK